MKPRTASKIALALALTLAAGLLLLAGCATTGTTPIQNGAGGGNLADVQGQGAG